MCGRFFIAEKDAPEDMIQIITTLNRKKNPPGLKTSGEIFPSDIVPVLANSRQQDIQPFAMQWGYSFPNSHPVINARSETASAKPLFKDGMLQRRCLIPATNYFEWEHRENQKIKYAIHPQNQDMLYLAGIYHLEKHNDVTVPTFTILTREASSCISFIHDRMPVIFPKDYITSWLDIHNKADDILHEAMKDMEYTAI